MRVWDNVKPIDKVVNVALGGPLLTKSEIGGILGKRHHGIWIIRGTSVAKCKYYKDVRDSDPEFVM